MAVIVTDDYIVHQCVTINKQYEHPKKYLTKIDLPWVN